MEARCKHCGEKFKITKQDQECDQLPDICEDCFLMYENNNHEEDCFSDADPGL